MRLGELRDRLRGLSRDRVLFDLDDRRAIQAVATITKSQEIEKYLGLVGLPVLAQLDPEKMDFNRVDHSKFTNLLSDDTLIITTGLLLQAICRMKLIHNLSNSRQVVNEEEIRKLLKWAEDGLESIGSKDKALRIRWNIQILDLLSGKEPEPF